MLTPVLPAFEVVARHRPVDLVRPWATPRATVVAPYVALEGAPGDALAMSAGAVRLRASYDGVARLEVTAGGTTTRHRSRRHGRGRAPVDRIGMALTGTHLSVLVRERGSWAVRGRVDLTDRLDTHDEEWLAGLVGDGSGDAWGGFGQLGLRDLRLVTCADGTAYRPGGAGTPFHLTATSAGPGFFDTAHTSVWSLDPTTLALTHTGDLFFRRPGGRPRVLGDHATHLVRDGDRWLVATSTWGDFDRRRAVGVTLARSREDLLRGTHVLDAGPLHLPTDGLASVGVWDPHLVRTGPGEWLVGFVNARRYFEFHPALAGGPDLEQLRLLGSDPRRRATEGTTLLRHGHEWWLLASDQRERSYPAHPVSPGEHGPLRRTARLDAPYLSNIPWPTLVPLAQGEGGGWLLVTFDGTGAGGRLPGYGTHGDVVVMRSVA
ncbi:hypothetical protein [Nocardioides sp. SYSU DS0663]|uniref:hypothetical protein n=1 Tax=Nocardioides sp. SYSU DS0663 TaxID=3416445 RepID=UPI003F4BCDC4